MPAELEVRAGGAVVVPRGFPWAVVVVAVGELRLTVLVEREVGGVRVPEANVGLGRGLKLDLRGPCVRGGGCGLCHGGKEREAGDEGDDNEDGSLDPDGHQISLTCESWMRTLLFCSVAKRCDDDTCDISCQASYHTFRLFANILSFFTCS